MTWEIINVTLDSFGKEKRDRMNDKKAFQEINSYFFTVLFVILNIVLFLICTFTGNLLYNKGAFYIWSIITDKEYYRFISAVFLHYDINHIFSNMILLFFIGRIVEKQVGHIAYFFLYLMAGICGNFVSGIWEMKSKQYSVSVGASGAVFGLTGALLVLVLFHKGRLEQIRWQGVILMIALSVYNGFTTDNINNAAHIGGLLTGILITIIVLIGKEALKSHTWKGART